MLVSVIIPCFNAEKYISETLYSVINQSYNDIEIICVDNGSTDKTVQIVNSFISENKNIVLLHQPVKGAPAARNMGLQMSKGKYVQFLDSDDIITPDKLEKQINFLLKSDVDVVVSDRVVYDESMNQLISYHTFADIESDPLATSISKIIITGNPLYLRSVIIEAGSWDETLDSAQDWELHIRLALKRAKFGYLKGYFLKSRSHRASLSANWIHVSRSGMKVLSALRKKIAQHDAVQQSVVQKKIFYCYFYKNF